MKRSTTTAKLLIAVGILTIGGFAVVEITPSFAQNDSGSPNRMPAAVVGTHELMEMFNQPLYKRLSAAMAKPPQNDRQWKTLAERGWQAAEIANLVAIRDHEHSTDAWTSFSSQLQRHGSELAEAAESKDFATAKEAYTSLIGTCNACHNRYGANHAPFLKP